MLSTAFVVFGPHYYKLPVNIDVVMSIEMSETFNFTHRMELKKLPHDVSKGIIVVTLQLVWKNCAAEDRMNQEKMAQKETSSFRLDLPSNLQKFGVSERLFLTLHVK